VSFFTMLSTGFHVDRQERNNLPRLPTSLFLEGPGGGGGGGEGGVPPGFCFLF
jgi:hypothetical protein